MQDNSPSLWKVVGIPLIILIPALVGFSIFGYTIVKKARKELMESSLVSIPAKTPEAKQS